MPPKDYLLHRSHTSDEREHIQLLLKVARLYYEQGATQAQIAKQVGYSRPTVSRLLTEAREKGVVHIRITHPLERAMSLENELQKKFNLQSVRIAQTTESNSSQHISRCAADYIIETSPEDISIAVSNGYAVNETIEAMPKFNWYRSRVVQAIGSIEDSQSMADASETCRRLASQLGGRHFALPVPLVVGSAEVAHSLRQNRQVATLLNIVTRVDMALVGIGTVDQHRVEHIFNSFTHPQIGAVLHEHKAVGHICGHHFDEQGQHIKTELCDQTIGITLQQLQKLPKVVAVAWGEDKIPAILGALRGRYINTLITDRSTAELLLEHS